MLYHHYRKQLALSLSDSSILFYKASLKKERLYMDPTIPLVLQSKTPIYLQIYQYIKREISHGSLLAGTRLPSHRNLAMQLNVSRITVESAYQQLLAEGYVESKPKRGIFVAEVDIDVIQKKQQIASNSANNKRKNNMIMIVVKDLLIKSFSHNKLEKSITRNFISV